jgi:uncharacterized membrane protein YdjX (TVP38/TMEM64 family)
MSEQTPSAEKKPGVGSGAAGPRPTAGQSTAAEEFKKLGAAGVLGLVWAFLPLAGSLVLYTYLSSVGAWLRGHEEAGLFVYAGAFAVLAGLGMMPTYATAILGGWAFGFATGYPAALCGFLGASLVGYAVARRASQDRVTGLIDGKPRWKAVREALVGGSWRKTFLIVTLVRLPPNSPFALTNLVLASVRVPFSAYVLGTLVGMAPRTGLVLYIASTLRDHLVEDVAKAKKPWWLIAAGIGLSLVVLVVIALISKRALERVTGSGQSSK